MSFTDQKPRVATEDDVKAPWSGGKNGKYFRCYLCGHKFQAGEYYRFIFHKFGNILVCQDCDKDNPAQKWMALHEEWDKLREGKFWHFIIRPEDGSRELERELASEARESRDEIKYWKDKALYDKEDR